ncbi:oxygenase MpaB family protein [Streptomyces sp. NPDC000594]|uniref:oxygenase MpaB family protein n=1 Tax=Streptomyces sp. NPDC000594 TaxID=3154261 RepID=UPI003324347D
MALTTANIASELEVANQAGDPEADKLVSDLIDNREIDGVNALFRTIGTLKPGQDLSGLPPRLAEFLKGATVDPPGWSGADVSAAESFFDHHHGVASMLQGTVGLIGTYLSPAGAYTLRSTGRLGGVKGPGRRLSQSSRLFIGMGDRGALSDGTLAATVTKVRLVHASVRQLHRKSGEWDHAQWGEPVSQKYTCGATYVFSVQILEAMRNLGLTVSRNDAQGFMAAWHYINHYLGTPERWLTPKDVGQATALWLAARDDEWKRTEDGRFMTAQALKFYQEEYLPEPSYSPFVAMVRRALSDKYADMAGIPRNAVLDTGAKLASAGHGMLSGIGGGLLGGSADKTVGVNPYDEIIGIASKQFNRVEDYALSRQGDDQPQMHEELGDDR